jgi:multicomponent Na+:H+ antiporter subunit D
MPAAGVLFFIGSLALAGIPPTGGFISKYLVFTSGAAASQILTLLLLAAGGLLTLIYTIRAFMNIWWGALEDGEKVKPLGDRILAPAVLIVFVIILGIWAEPLLQVSQHVTTWMADPLNYIQAVLDPFFAQGFGG